MARWLSAALPTIQTFDDTRRDARALTLDVTAKRANTSTTAKRIFQLPGCVVYRKYLSHICLILVNSGLVPHMRAPAPSEERKARPAPRVVLRYGGRGAATTSDLTKLSDVEPQKFFAVISSRFYSQYRAIRHSDSSSDI